MKEKLRELQMTQLEILKIIDSICRDNHIKYSLYAGTLLGAVRHKGFIPWDDDLDVCMERSEYDRFINIWENVKPNGYILQNKENTPEFTQSFTKIRKEHTTFLQYDSERGKYHTGIFVDIFPIDRRPGGNFRQLIFKVQCMLYQLFTREFFPPKEKNIIKIISAILLFVVPKNCRGNVRSKLLGNITKWNKDRTLETVAIETMASLRIRYPIHMLDNYTECVFENEKFMCFEDWDEHLKCKFGEYMKLPPEEDRDWKHHPIILDFEHNYEELQN